MSPRSEAESEELASTFEYSPEERSELLQLAHQAIESVFDRQAVDLTPPSEHLADMRGAFVSLHLNGKLRGCIGYVLPSHSLYRTVAEAARAAALPDRAPVVAARAAARSSPRAATVARSSRA